VRTEAAVLLCIRLIPIIPRLHLLQRKAKLLPFQLSGYSQILKPSMANFFFSRALNTENTKNACKKIEI
jgi:hypothetical protein